MFGRATIRLGIGPHSSYQVDEEEHSSLNFVSARKHAFCLSQLCKMGEYSVGIFTVAYGVHQGSVLAPFLFAVYLDNLCEMCGILIAVDFHCIC